MSPDLIDLSSTESTGGSTTGDDEAAGGDGGGGRDAACGGADSTLSQETRAPRTLLETRRNTQVSRGLVNPNQGGPALPTIGTSKRNMFSRNESREIFRKPKNFF